MEQYPSNSHKTREKELNREPLKLPEKKMQKATLKGAVRTKKKSTARKLLDTFVVEDSRTIKDYVLNDVLKPAIRDAIEDIVTNGIHILLRGEPQRGGSKRKTPGSTVSYQKYYDGRDTYKRDYRKPVYQQAFDYDDVILENRGDAEYILDQMYDAIKAYKIVTVADLCELLGISAPYTANKYGWTDLNNARIERVRGGYLLVFPKAFPIDD